MENNITRLFGRRLSLILATQLAVVFARTSFAILQGGITLPEFPVVKEIKTLVFACGNSLHS